MLMTIDTTSTSNMNAYIWNINVNLEYFVTLILTNHTIKNKQEDKKENQQKIATI